MNAIKHLKTHYASDIRSHVLVNDTSFVHPIGINPFPYLSKFPIFEQIFEQITSDNIERIADGLFNLINVVSSTHKGKYSTQIPHFSDILPIIFQYYHSDNIVIHNASANIINLIITESPLAMIWVSPTCVIDSVIFSACLPSYQ